MIICDCYVWWREQNKLELIYQIMIQLALSYIKQISEGERIWSSCMTYSIFFTVK